MAKVQAVKSKSSFGDFLRKLGGGGSPKAKPAGRPPSSTMTNLKAQGAAGSQQAMKAAAAQAAAAKLEPSGLSMEGFRLPVIGHRPVINQLQVLGTLALLLIASVALLVFIDVNARSINATYITIASQ